MLSYFPKFMGGAWPPKAKEWLRPCSLPWAITGDFNEILMSDDKFGGRNVNINRALRFQDCLDNCKMLDIGFTSFALPGQTVDR